MLAASPRCKKFRTIEVITKVLHVTSHPSLYRSVSNHSPWAAPSCLPNLSGSFSPQTHYHRLLLKHLNHALISPNFFFLHHNPSYRPQPDYFSNTLLRVHPPLQSLHCPPDQAGAPNAARPARSLTAPITRLQ